MKSGRNRETRTRIPKRGRAQASLPKNGSSFGNAEAIEGVLNAFDQRRVKELAEALRRCGRILGPINTKLWRTFFCGLRDKGIAKNRIRAVLYWFIEHIRDEGMPMVRSARSFTRLFFALEKRSKEPTTPDEISTTAVTIADALAAARQWPGTSDRQLPAAVQASMNNYKAFLEKLACVMQQLAILADKDEGQTLTSIDRRTLLCMEEIQNRLPPVETFVTGYMERVHKVVWDWTSWTGDLLRQAFTSRRPSFVTFISNTIAMHTHEVAQRSRVLELLGIETDEDRQS